MILITTAGKVGAEAARLLAAQGEPVRVLVRNPQKVAALSQAGVEVGLTWRCLRASMRLCGTSHP